MQHEVFSAGPPCSALSRATCVRLASGRLLCQGEMERMGPVGDIAVLSEDGDGAVCVCVCVFVGRTVVPPRRCAASGLRSS